MDEQRLPDQAQSPQHLLRDVLAVAPQVEVRGWSVPELRNLAQLAGRVKSSMDSLLVAVTAEIAASGAAASPERVLQQATTMSKRDARRLARTAEGLQGMPNLAGLLADGEVSLDNTAALVDTARETGAEAVDGNADLLDCAAETPADLFARQARRFADRHAEDRGESRHRRQRRRRSLSFFDDPDTGMGRLSGWLDPVRYGLVRQAIDNHADQLRRSDTAHSSQPDRNAGRTDGIAAGGGLSGETGNRRRTATQRRADALVELATERNALTLRPLDMPDSSSDNSHHQAGTGSHGSQSDKGKATLRGAAGKVLQAGGSGGNAQAAANGTDRGEGRAVTQLVIVADLGLIDGTDPNGRCEMPGTGPVPPSILEQLSPDTRIVGALFSGTGQPLWLGRSRRNPNAHQRLAVAVRDRGCVQCGAPMHQCQVHHIRPWEQGGPTDIDNLAALCREHHRQHHGPHDHCDHRDVAGGDLDGPSRNRPPRKPAQADGRPGSNRSRTRDGP